MVRYLCLCLSCCVGACGAQSQNVSPAAEQMEQYLGLLKGKAVGLVVNQTSLVGTTHLVDTLLSQSIEVKKVFAPEHGFRGEKSNGEVVEDGKDISTGLPIISLYGSNKKPSAEQIRDVEVLVFDIQDVGTRFYTYISTMHYVMEACAEQGKKLIVLDRPNPHGSYVDGPVREKSFRSFVGMHPIPIVHGLTVGELAQMINGEGWLEHGTQCDLRVVPVKNYTHSATYSLPVSPSPNLPNDLAILLYPSLCLFEGTDISEGRGTYKPFQQIGHPSFTDMPHQFKPKSIVGMSLHPKHENQTCYGLNFENMEVKREFTLKYLLDFYHRFEEKDRFFNRGFNRLAGNATLQQQIKNGLTEEEIRATWQPELKAYKILRKKYLLYPDSEP